MSDTNGYQGRGPTVDRRLSVRLPTGWTIGVITVLDAETAAVVDLMRNGDMLTGRAREGRYFHEARLRVSGAPVGIVCTQAQRPGQRSALVAYGSLRSSYAPDVIALIGVGAGVHEELAVGDVVVASEVTYYEPRRADLGPGHRSLPSYRPPAPIRRATAAFFASHLEPAWLTRYEQDQPVGFKALPGPIASGDVANHDRDEADRAAIRAMDPGTLAVETEAAGLAVAHQEDGERAGTPVGWLVIRGIADETHQPLAAKNAAYVLEKMLPYLMAARS